MNPQRFLLLQGPCSPFFRQLGLALRRAGHSVHKVNFTVGDRLYWRLGQATNYRGAMTQLSAFYAEQYTRHDITDLVLFGDCRPVHRPAIALAQAHNLRVHVFEEGYFRPHWITLEEGGVNGHSHLPRDPDWYYAQASCVNKTESVTAFHSAFWQRVAHDVTYNLGAVVNPLLHPGVQSHVSYHPYREYLGYLRRGVRLPWRNAAARKTAQQLIAQAAHTPFYLLPLQLDSDAQIVHHSPFASMTQAMLHTLDSFARTAPTHTRLAVKLHPLDPGLVNYRKTLLAAAHALGIESRVFFLASGHLPTLLTACAGVVTVNSTVGGSALIHQRPVIALGTAIYALPGLTFQGGLDDFWHTRTPPDKTLLRHFRDVVIARTQIHGGFYCCAGITLAVGNAVERLRKPTTTCRSRLPESIRKTGGRSDR